MFDCILIDMKFFCFRFEEPFAIVKSRIKIQQLLIILLHKFKPATRLFCFQRNIKIFVQPIGTKMKCPQTKNNFFYSIICLMFNLYTISRITMPRDEVVGDLLGALHSSHHHSKSYVNQILIVLLFHSKRGKHDYFQHTLKKGSI